ASPLLCPLCSLLHCGISIRPMSLGVRLPRDVAGTGSLGEQAVVADAVEALRQDVHEEAADESGGGLLEVFLSAKPLTQRPGSAFAIAPIKREVLLPLPTCRSCAVARSIIACPMR